MNSESEKLCHICKNPYDESHYNITSDVTSINCSVCGKYFFNSITSFQLDDEDIKFSSKLSAWIREHKELGVEPPIITTDTINTLRKTLPDYRVSEKQLILLRAFERIHEDPGGRLIINPDCDYPLSWAIGTNEFEFLMRGLLERGLIRDIDDSFSKFDEGEVGLVITPDGWDFLDKHAKSSVISDQAFVAMAFSDDLKSAFNDAIYPAIRKANFKPYRVDAEPHTDQIDVKIITEIKNSRFLVADVTHQRPGVYFEAGFAIGLGLPVIWCCRDDDKENIHFDTRQYNHIFWKDKTELEEQLYYYVSAIIGKGSYTGD